jgi:hypothetical protein
VLRLFALAALAFALTGCSGDGAYSTEEVIEAFQRQSITLTIGERTDEGVILAPQGELSFVVLVATEEAADEEWDAYLAQSDRRSFDARHKNVLVASDNGDTGPRLRQRIRAALASLPEE